MQRTVQRFWSFRETSCTRIFWEQWKFIIEPPIADPHTDAEPQGNLLQNYERKFEQLLDDQKSSKLCSDAGLKIVEEGQFFITHDAEAGPNETKNLCREFSLIRSEEASRARGWIIGNTKIGLVLDVKVCLHQELSGIEILIESLFRE